MLTNIKSKYILELLLSLITEKKKLKILIYNKSLKTKLSLNLEVYQKAIDRITVSEFIQSPGFDELNKKLRNGDV